ncbi:hypothetical protein AMELA_G00026360 [Ameiurus melas]|uniref:Uncharacterized protein n=1 Tax=Ameiurus melas TaxID=219545 RepID=A0A7J6BE66_AMEME|nr:hypothetical protein AMELA_G00026360 [Ameiurus melas]
MTVCTCSQFLNVPLESFLCCILWFVVLLEGSPTSHLHHPGGWQQILLMNLPCLDLSGPHEMDLTLKHQPLSSRSTQISSRAS